MSDLQEILLISVSNSQCGNLCILLSLTILREIKFGDFKGSKTVTLAILKAMNYDFWENRIFEIVNFP